MEKQNINEILSKDHIKSIEEMSYNMGIVQKLNEELTKENDKILTKLEEYNRKSKIILTIGVVVIYSLAVLAIISFWLLKHKTL